MPEKLYKLAKRKIDFVLPLADLLTEKLHRRFKRFSLPLTFANKKIVQNSINSTKIVAEQY